MTVQRQPLDAEGIVICLALLLFASALSVQNLAIAIRRFHSVSLTIKAFNSEAVKRGPMSLLFCFFGSKAPVYIIMLISSDCEFKYHRSDEAAAISANADCGIRKSDTISKFKDFSNIFLSTICIILIYFLFAFERRVYSQSPLDLGDGRIFFRN